MNGNLIIDRLWISDWEAAHSPTFIKTNKINVILNMTKDVANKFTSKLEYGRVSLDDSLQQKDYDIMTVSLPYCVEFIHKHRDLDNKTVLVHCHQGMQRSCAAVLGYLLKYHPTIAPTIKKGAKFIHSKRSAAWHDNSAINFDQSLEKYYRKYIKAPVKVTLKPTVKNVKKVDNKADNKILFRKIPS